MQDLYRLKRNSQYNYSQFYYYFYVYNLCCKKRKEQGKIATFLMLYLTRIPTSGLVGILVK